LPDISRPPTWDEKILSIVAQTGPGLPTRSRRNYALSSKVRRSEILGRRPFVRGRARADVFAWGFGVRPQPRKRLRSATISPGDLPVRKVRSSTHETRRLVWTKSYRGTMPKVAVIASRDPAGCRARPRPALENGRRPRHEAPRRPPLHPGARIRRVRRAVRWLQPPRIIHAGSSLGTHFGENLQKNLGRENAYRVDIGQKTRSCGFAIRSTTPSS